MMTESTSQWIPFRVLPVPNASGKNAREEDFALSFPGLTSKTLHQRQAKAIFMTPKQKAHKIDTQIFFVLQQKF
jgi:hypothetical protein